MTQRDTWLKVCGWPMREHKPGGRLLGECKLNPPGGAASHLLPRLTLERLTVGGRGCSEGDKAGHPAPRRLPTAPRNRAALWKAGGQSLRAVHTKVCARTKACTHVFTAASPVAAGNWRPPKCPTKDKRTGVCPPTRRTALSSDPLQTPRLDLHQLWSSGAGRRELGVMDVLLTVSSGVTVSRVCANYV